MVHRRDGKVSLPFPALNATIPWHLNHEGPPSACMSSLQLALQSPLAFQTPISETFQAINLLVS